MATRFNLTMRTRSKSGKFPPQERILSGPAAGVHQGTIMFLTQLLLEMLRLSDDVQVSIETVSERTS